jgi:hypothetical protein
VGTSSIEDFATPRGLDERTYEKGIKVSDAEMDALDIRGDTFHPEWNYTVHHGPKSSNSYFCLSP